jgi:hypothetical protein
MGRSIFKSCQKKFLYYLNDDIFKLKLNENEIKNYFEIFIENEIDLYSLDMKSHVYINILIITKLKIF